jgi:putative spermidine/putrescine transport system ATP-binding protein
MTMADLVVVMGKGTIRQAAPPIEIYRKPADAFVADFIGSTNLCCRRRRRRATVLGRPSPALRPAGGMARGALDPPGRRPWRARRRAFDGTVTFVRDLGGTIETFVESTVAHVAVSTPRDRPT